MFFIFFLLLFIYAFFTTSACQSVSPVHYRSLLFSVKSCKSFKADFLQPQNKNKYSIFITCYYYLSFLLTLYFPPMEKNSSFTHNIFLLHLSLHFCHLKKTRFLVLKNLVQFWTYFEDKTRIYCLHCF